MFTYTKWSWPNEVGSNYGRFTVIRRKPSLLCIVLIAIVYTCGHILTQSRAAPVISAPEETQSYDDTFFPLGFMGVQDEDAFSQIAAGGFNVVYEFRSVQEIDEAEDYLEQAKIAGLYVVQNMPDCRAYLAPQFYCQSTEVWNEDQWAQFISTLAAYDNLTAWFLPDEITDYAAAADLYAWIQKYDPQKRPIFGNPGTYQQSVIDLFPAFTDFLWATGYPNHREEPRALVTYAMQRDANACSGTGTRWGAILQFFDSADFGGSGGYPTAHQIRCDSYQAIIGGATGLWYFNYTLGQDLTELLTGIEKVADEIIGTGGLEEVILSPDVPQTITRTIVSGPTQSPVVQGEIYDSIQTLQKEHQGTYLFAVNIATDTVVAEFRNLPIGTEGVQVLFESRTIPVSEGIFRDTFAEADVHVYRVVASFIFLPLVMKPSL